MIETFDNLSQLLTVLLCGVLSGVAYLRTRRQPWFLLTCFYGCFMLAILYWLLYTTLFPGSMPVFYVSDIGWISCYLFLHLLQCSLSSQGERNFRCRAQWLAPGIEILLTVYFIRIGDVLYNLIVGVLLTALCWCSIRGLIYYGREGKSGRGMQVFHLMILCMLAAENLLWLSSYPWAGNTLANPYFWFDFLLTATLLGLYPAMRKAVGV